MKLGENKKYPHLVEEVERWPINRLYSNKEFAIREINALTMKKIEMQGAEAIGKILAKTIYHELVRIRTNPWKVDPPNEKSYWKKLEEEFKSNNQSEYEEELNREMLHRIINRYSLEIAGNFDPKTFRFARKLLTTLFKKIFNKAAFIRFITFWGKKPELEGKMKVLGHIDTMRSLFKEGTVVIVPNHISNIDSILIGYVIDQKVGVPAFSYGAGLNLYDYELLAYLINRLGAYKLDRRKKNPIYLETLKSFSTITLMKGVNTIFFPGGTRSRSGEIEKHAKLGLLSTLMEAQRLMAQRGLEKKIFVVPLHIGYHFVLEAGYFVEDYLIRSGKEEYLKGKKTKITIRRLMRLLKDSWTKESDVLLNFGRPMDIFGNLVDEQGVSYDEHGRKIDIIDYYKFNGRVNFDGQREREYTFQLGEKIIKSYKEENLILDSQLVSFLAFEYFRAANKDVDFYSIFNLPKETLVVKLPLFIDMVDKAISYLNHLNKKFNLTLYNFNSRTNLEIVQDGIKNLGIYHKNKVLKMSNNYVTTDSIRLLYYYHNRLKGYGIENIFMEFAVEPMEL